MQEDTRCQELLILDTVRSLRISFMYVSIFELHALRVANAGGSVTRDLRGDKPDWHYGAHRDAQEVFKNV